jgi:hypothetical protein
MTRFIAVLLSASVLIATGCAKKQRSEFGEPFVFVGVPASIDPKIHVTVNGRQRAYILRIIEIKKGKLIGEQTFYEFPEEATPPLEIGREYLFSGGYDRHGGYFDGVTKQK